MTVFEPGPGMGFFTLELARRVGAHGKVVAVDIQPRMLAGLRKRAAKAGLLDRIDARLATPDSMGLADLAGTVDLALAFAVVHELPSAEAFFREAANVLRTGACLLLVEPSGHVKPAQFQAELAVAAKAGLTLAKRPAIRRNHAALLEKVGG
jgi:SAM-dependent methyltransferase